MPISAAATTCRSRSSGRSSHWLRQLFGFPDTASGLFVTGTSMANLIGVLVARTRALGVAVRRDGVAAAASVSSPMRRPARMAAFAQAMDLSGLGTAALHVIPCNELHQIDIDALNGRDRAGSRRGADALSRGRHCRHGRYRRHRRSRRARRHRARREALVPRRRRHWRARHHGARYRAAACRHRAGRFDRARFPQMGPGALRRRLHPGARRRAAPRHFCFARRLSAARDARACRRHGLALRFRPRSVARLPCAEDLVHAEGLRHRGARRDDVAQLRARPLSRDQDRRHARAGVAGAGLTQHRLLPLSRRRCRPAERRDRRRPARIRHRRAVVDDHRCGRARHPRGDRQPPHRAARHRRHGQGDSALRREP